MEPYRGVAESTGKKRNAADVEKEKEKHQNSIRIPDQVLAAPQKKTHRISPCIYMDHLLVIPISPLSTSNFQHPLHVARFGIHPLIDYLLDLEVSLHDPTRFQEVELRLLVENPRHSPDDDDDLVRM